MDGQRPISGLWLLAQPRAPWQPRHGRDTSTGCATPAAAREFPEFDEYMLRRQVAAVDAQRAACLGGWRARELKCLPRPLLRPWADFYNGLERHDPQLPSVVDYVRSSLLDGRRRRGGRKASPRPHMFFLLLPLHRHPRRPDKCLGGGDCAAEHGRGLQRSHRAGRPASRSCRC